jgi:hypothetical protein
LQQRGDLEQVIERIASDPDEHLSDEDRADANEWPSSPPNPHRPSP